MTKRKAFKIVCLSAIVLAFMMLMVSCTAYKNTTCGKIHDTNQFIGYK